MSRARDGNSGIPGEVRAGMDIARIVVRLAPGLIVLASWAQPAHGCSCGASSIPEEIWSADAVFTGRVVEIWPIRVTADGYDGIAQRATLRVDARFENPLRPPLPTPTAETLFNAGGNCDYRFERGEAYLVFAYRGADGELRTSKCSSTRTLAEVTAADLAAFTVNGFKPTALDRGPVAPESLIHLAARRGALAALVATGAARAVWRGWGDTASGLFLRLALTLAGVGALPTAILLLRRRRFVLCAQIFLAGPLVVGASALGWAYWYALSHAWLADLAR